MEAEKEELTNLLRAWSQGNQRALSQLVPRVHGELKRLAHVYMAGERVDHPLQSTALINEAYVRLISWKNVEWQNRAHFFAIAAQLMRRVLVDAARARRQAKRGGGAFDITLHETRTPGPVKSRDVIALDEALQVLATIDERKSRVVELRFFGGLSVRETAVVLETSERTVLREWNFARAWLKRELGGKPDERTQSRKPRARTAKT